MISALFAVLAAQALAPHEFYATSVTTTQLASACAKSQSDPTVLDFCTGYITATFDALSINNVICSRPGVSTPQIIAIGRRQISDNPQSWDKQPSWLLAQSFKKEFRCS
jgi:hypothetical protein